MAEVVEDEAEAAAIDTIPVVARFLITLTTSIGVTNQLTTVGAEGDTIKRMVDHLEVVCPRPQVGIDRTGVDYRSIRRAGAIGSETDF